MRPPVAPPGSCKGLDRTPVLPPTRAGTGRAALLERDAPPPAKPDSRGAARREGPGKERPRGRLSRKCRGGALATVGRGPPDWQSPERRPSRAAIRSVGGVVPRGQRNEGAENEGRAGERGTRREDAGGGEEGGEGGWPSRPPERSEHAPVTRCVLPRPSDGSQGGGQAPASTRCRARWCGSRLSVHAFGRQTEPSRRNRDVRGGVQPENRFRCGGTAGWRRSLSAHSAYGQLEVASTGAALARVVAVAASASARSGLCRPGAPPVYWTSAGTLFRAWNKSTSLDAYRESHICHPTRDPLRRVRPGPPTSAPPSSLRQARSADPPGCSSPPELLYLRSIMCAPFICHVLYNWADRDQKSPREPSTDLAIVCWNATRSCEIRKVTNLWHTAPPPVQGGLLE